MDLEGKINKAKKIFKQDERTKRIALTAITSALSRVLSILVPLIIVRIAIERLGAETYGLWMTVTAFFSLFTFADLGLGSGLQTKLSRLHGSKDNREAQMLISSSLMVLTVVASVILLVFCLLFSEVNWIKVMNAESEQTITVVATVVLAVVLSKIANVPLGLVQRTQYGFQEGYISNIWNGASSILSLIIVYLLAQLSIAPIWIIWGSSFAPVFVAAVNHFAYFNIQHPEIKPRLLLFRRNEAFNILNIGFQFMILSILTTIGLSMDSYIIAQTSSLENVTPYSIGYRIAMVMGAATIMLSTPLWAANGEALSKKDFSWVRKTTKKMSRMSLGVTLLGSIIFLVFGSHLIDLWLNNNVKIPFLLMAGLLLMQIVQSFISPYFMVLNGAGIVKKQIILFSIYTPVSLCIKYYLSIQFGFLVVPWIGVILYTLLIALPTYILAKKVYTDIK
ncbi:MATE family efflux transporter [Bacillus sp. FJAT-49732]|uniref:MATE family efflux transporter n=1 Tax=Lederbergia citrisecunda TaxID=2833583 RepID=A0A942TRM7_9BACI|nr:MATE family efflux transporter [Lederbergia citrisecunda]MBS4200594.1 MATE family efflux transporter [Lederbergia citrisecunda]